MRRLVNIILLVAFVTGIGYVWKFHQNNVRAVVGQVEAKFAPCRSPISYSFGSIDKRFGIPASILVADLKDAEAVWETPSGKNLFQYEVAGGAVVVNLVYDNRQAAADRLRAAGIQIDKTTSSYDLLKAQYGTFSARVNSETSQLEQDIAAYKSREAAYNAEVAQWNRKGGAPQDAYAQLQQEKSALEIQANSLEAEQAKVNDDIDTMNALATTLNQLIVQLNLNVAQYNNAGASQGEFEEGLYESAAGVRKIDIYEYSSHNELVRVLAHEMGHALGLEHVADPKAIMYKVNQGESLKATPADITELNAVCKSGIF